MKIAPAIVAVFPLLVGAYGCSETVEPLIIDRCLDDVECGPGFICDNGECVPKTNVSCMAVEGGAAILQPGPPVLEFSRVGPATSFRSLRLRNIGNCTLTIFEVYFEGGTETAFECPRCNSDRFPIELFPLREDEIEISFTPEGVGDFNSDLHLVSDDGEYSDIVVPVRARFDGVPEAAVQPAELDFSYVQQGRTETKTIQISNHGTGSALLAITDIRIQPTGTTAWSLAEELTFPIELAPIAEDPTAELSIEVNYHPRAIGANAAEVVIITNQLRNGTIRVPIRGTSQTPPAISIAPARLEFGEVPLGQTNVLPVTIINEGGAPLTVSYEWRATGFNTDLTALPVIVPRVEPGAFTELQVFATATSIGEISGLLIINSNDPSTPSISIPVTAQGTDVIGTEVIKIEMAYENGDSGFFGNDLRNVDMTLENPFGLICNKQNAAPTDWGAFGTPTWISFGSNEEPERIVLPNAQQDGTYRVILQYAEDCSSVPTQLIASVLGISIDALLSYFSGGTVMIDGGDVSDAISNLCLDHDATSATVTVYVNGQVIAERASGLGRKGDLIYALDIVRQGGVFTVQ